MLAASPEPLRPHRPNPESSDAPLPVDEEFGIELKLSV